MRVIPCSGTLEHRMNIRRLVANLLELSTMLVSLSHPSKSDASDELVLLVRVPIFQAVDRRTARPVPTLSLTLQGLVVIEYGAEVDTRPISLRLIRQRCTPLMGGMGIGVLFSSGLSSARSINSSITACGGGHSHGG